jgi:flagella basal body P-ring formation protein FlgA
VIRADTGDLQQRCEQVRLGLAPPPGESVVIDRPTLRARMATEGIAGRQVRFAGAERIRVRRRTQVIDAGRILKAAEALMDERQQGAEAARWRCIRRPSELRLAETRPAELAARTLESTAADLVRIEVAAVVDGRELATAEVQFRLEYPVKIPVAVENLSRGTVLTPANCRLETVYRSRPAPRDFRPPYSLLAAEPIARGAVIEPWMVRPAGRIEVLQRGQPVVMEIARRTWRVRALGEALEDGEVDQVIRVRNVDSGRIVSARVNYDGTVTPVIAEASDNERASR